MMLDIKGEASASSFLCVGGDYTAPFRCDMLMVSIKEGERCDRHLRWRKGAERVAAVGS